MSQFSDRVFFCGIFCLTTTYGGWCILHSVGMGGQRQRAFSCLTLFFLKTKQIGTLDVADKNNKKRHELAPQCSFTFAGSSESSLCNFLLHVSEKIKRSPKKRLKAQKEYYWWGACLFDVHVRTFWIRIYLCFFLTLLFLPRKLFFSTIWWVKNNTLRKKQNWLFFGSLKFAKFSFTGLSPRVTPVFALMTCYTLQSSREFWQLRELELLIWLFSWIKGLTSFFTSMA